MIGPTNEYPQFIFWSKNKKNRYAPAYPRFAIKKVGFKGYSLYEWKVNAWHGAFQLDVKGKGKEYNLYNQSFHLP